MKLSSSQEKSEHSYTSRFYESEADLRRMDDLLMQARSLTGDWRYWHVGELAFNFFMVACHLDPREHVRLWEVNGKLVGFAILGEDPSIDCQVLPDYAWTGIEAEALDWAERHIVELRSRKGFLGDKLVAWSRPDDEKRLRFLEQHGFRYCGDFAEINLMRSVDEPIPESELPDGFSVRELAETGEISRRAAAYREVWEPWPIANISDEDYARFTRLPAYDRFLDIVTVAPGGAIVAFVNGWTDPVNRIGDFGPVGAVPAYRRQGLTRLALLESLRRMKIRGMNRVCISTGISNTPARRLYESIGFKPENQYFDFVKPIPD